MEFSFFDASEQQERNQARAKARQRYKAKQQDNDEPKAATRGYRAKPVPCYKVVTYTPQGGRSSIDIRTKEDFNDLVRDVCNSFRKMRKELGMGYKGCRIDFYATNNEGVEVTRLSNGVFCNKTKTTNQVERSHTKLSQYSKGRLIYSVTRKGLEAR